MIENKGFRWRRGRDSNPRIKVLQTFSDPQDTPQNQRDPQIDPINRSLSGHPIAPGIYRMRNGRIAQVSTVEAGYTSRRKVFGHCADMATWWYQDGGFHNLFPCHDLIEVIAVRQSCGYEVLAGVNVDEVLDFLVPESRMGNPV